MAHAGEGVARGVRRSDPARLHARGAQSAALRIEGAGRLACRERHRHPRHHQRRGQSKRGGHCGPSASDRPSSSRSSRPGPAAISTPCSTPSCSSGAGRNEQIRPRRYLHPGRLGQTPHERLVGFARVPTLNAPHRRVRFQRRRIDADRLPPHPGFVGSNFRTLCRAIEIPARV